MIRYSRVELKAGWQYGVPNTPAPDLAWQDRPQLGQMSGAGSPAPLRVPLGEGRLVNQSNSNDLVPLPLSAATQFLPGADASRHPLPVKVEDPGARRRERGPGGRAPRVFTLGG